MAFVSPPQSRRLNLSVGFSFCFVFFFSFLVFEEELHGTRNISTLLTGEDAVEALNRNTKVVALN